MDLGGGKEKKALEQYGVDLTTRAKAGKLDPVIGRDAESRWSPTWLLYYCLGDIGFCSSEAMELLSVLLHGARMELSWGRT